MREGDVALAALPQADGQRKLRPVLLLRELPGHGDYLVCGLSTQLSQEIKGFDEIISPTDPDFVESGVAQASLIRLAFLAVAIRSNVAGTIGRISASRHYRLLSSLSAYLLDRE
jgi:mRNA interferase MazF